jgi:hypothetical protein
MIKSKDFAANKSEVGNEEGKSYSERLSALLIDKFIENFKSDSKRLTMLLGTIVGNMSRELAELKGVSVGEAGGQHIANAVKDNLNMDGIIKSLGVQSLPRDLIEELFGSCAALALCQVMAKLL